MLTHFIATKPTERLYVWLSVSITIEKIVLSTIMSMQREAKKDALVSPPVPDSRIFFEGCTEGGYLLRTTLQHVILHISLEGAVEILKGISFTQGKDLSKDHKHTGYNSCNHFCHILYCCVEIIIGYEQVA